MIGKDFKYKLVKNFLNESERDLANKYFVIKHRSNGNSFDENQMATSTCDSYWYGDPLAESFLLAKKDLMEKETGLNLNPTYAFARVYTYLATLDKHKDRNACEVSVTVMLGSSGEEWPIYIDGKEFNLKPGDAAIYLGCEVEHWREEFKGDWHSQFFLHYVNKDGPNAHLICDGRDRWGVQHKWK